MRVAERVLLIGDIGGTNARFALANPESSGYAHSENFQCRDFPAIEQALHRYLDQAGVGRPDAICLAAAGPVTGGSIRLTNNHWVIDSAALQDAFGPVPVSLINDFEAVAHSLPLLGDQDLVAIGPGVPRLEGNDSFKVGVLGPGTGLGVAGLFSKKGVQTHVVGEGGHVGFSPATADQVLVHTLLMKKMGRVFNEALLSGPGLENVYIALSESEGLPPAPLSAQDVFEQSMSGADPIAVRERRKLQHDLPLFGVREQCYVALGQL
jgi:glucokinase